MVQNLPDAGNGSPLGKDLLKPAVGGPGTMVLWLKAAPVPDGWLPCDGRCYPSDVSPVLYSLLEGNKMKGDPAGYFRVPNAGPLIPAGAIVQLIIRL